MAHTVIKSDNITLGPVTLSFPNLFEARSVVNDEGRPVFSTKIVLTAEQANVVWQQCQALAAQAFPGGEYNNQAIAFHWPLYTTESQATQPHLAEKFPGHYVMNPKTGEQFPPQVVGADREPLLDKSLVYGGAKAYVIISLRSFQMGNKYGLGVDLHVVMVWGEGEPMAEGSQINVKDALAGIQVTPVNRGPVMGQQPGMRQQPVQQRQPVQQQAPTHGIPAGATTITGTPIGQMPQQQQPVQQSFGQPMVAPPGAQVTQQAAVNPNTGQPIPTPDFTQ